MSVSHSQSAGTNAWGCLGTAEQLECLCIPIAMFWEVGSSIG
jgi:hypothetical protein